MADPRIVQGIIDCVTIPVMAKARIGHFVEAQVLEGMGVDMIDESEVLTPADPFFHIDKRAFTVPFVCGARSLGEATRRISEGAAMIRTKGEAGTGNVVEAVRHRRQILRAVQEVQRLDKEQLRDLAAHYTQRYAVLLGEVRQEAALERELDAKDVLFPKLTKETATDALFDVLVDIHRLGRLPVVDFAAGGIATPADAALMMQLGNDGVFVGSGIFKSNDPATRARAIVEATTHFDDPKVIAEVSVGLGEAMKGQSIEAIPASERLQERGW